MLFTAQSLAAFAPFAGAGVFSVYNDPTGSCMVADVQPGMITAYVYHRTPEWELGVTGSAFRIVAGGGFSGTLVSSEFTPGFLTSGDPTTGVMVAYGSCLPVPSLLVVRVTYEVFGNSPSCSYVEIQGHPDSGVVEIYDCASTMEAASATTPLIFNASTGCTCGVLPVASSTWGRIKVFYRR